MRILKISCQFMPEVFGGAEQQCLRQAAALARLGHSVTILTSRCKLTTLSSEQIDGVQIYRPYTFYPPDLLGRYIIASLIWTFQIIWMAFTLRGKVDVVHCHQGKFGLFTGSIAAQILGVPQVVKIGNSSPFMDLQSLQRKKVVGPISLWIALRNKPVFVAISQVIKQDLHDFGLPYSQVRKIVNGVVITSEEFQSSYNPSRSDFFWHGRFEEIKNLPLMIDGFAIAAKKSSEIFLFLVGSGTLESKLVAQVKSHGMEERILIVKPQSNIKDYISRYNIFLNTSLAEGMSNSLLESLSLGKVLVSTNVSGTAEIIDNGVNGYIIPETTPERVASSVLLAHTLYHGNYASIFKYNRAKTINEFSIDVIAKQYESLYKDLSK